MKEKRFQSFKEQLRKILILYMLVPILFFAVAGRGMIYFLEYKAVKDENIENTKILAKDLDEAVRKYFNEVEKISSEEDVINAVLNKKADKVVYQKVYDSINSMNVEGNFVIYDKNLHIIMSSAEFIGSETGYNWGLFNRMIGYPGGIILKINRLYFQNGISTLSVGKAIRNKNEIIGFAVYNIFDNSLKELIGKSGSFNVVVTDKFGNVVVTTNENFKDNFGKAEKNLRKAEGYSVIDKEKYYVNKKEIYYSNLVLYTISSVGYVVDNFIDKMIYIIIFFFTILAAMYYAAKIIAEKKTKVIEEIVKAIENIKTGDLETRLNVETNDEFGIIADSYNEMLLNIKKLIEINKEEAKHSAVMEIKQLESQFNPHFLFNTLEMLRYTIKYDTSVANKIIINISSLLRFSIENKSSEVSLQRDLLYTKNYLDIQKYRFGENFDYEIKAEEGLENYYVPKLIIQPVIENAIKHGYTQVEKMIIYIRVKTVKEKLIISVYNNGKEIEKEILDEIREKLKNKKAEEFKNHIGLYNIFRRIQLMYGEKYGLRILSRKNRGTSVHVSLPLKSGVEK
ncbi:histidine kinase [Fusobacterium sp. SB021]|uniref:sensor histidine kinase n=1 Tax=Fusobacterium sp. SB021 TaxID=2744227 RepID=UPI003CEAD17C